jgi:hypothetical protein
MAAHGSVPTELACFVDAVDLMGDIRNLPKSGTQEGNEQRTRAALESIAKDRHCSAWYPYKPGFNPIEHYEQLEMQRIENDRRAFELQLARMGERAQERSAMIAEESKQLVAGLKEIAEKNDTFSRRVTFWIILLAVLQVVGALVALPSVPWVQRFWHYLFGLTFSSLAAFWFCLLRRRLHSQQATDRIARFQRMQTDRSSLTSGRIRIR